MCWENILLFDNLIIFLLFRVDDLFSRPNTAGTWVSTDGRRQVHDLAATYGTVDGMMMNDGGGSIINM